MNPPGLWLPVESCKCWPHRSATSTVQESTGIPPDSWPPQPPRAPAHETLLDGGPTGLGAVGAHSPAPCPHLGVVSVPTGVRVPRDSGLGLTPPHGQAGEGKGPQSAAGAGRGELGETPSPATPGLTQDAGGLQTSEPLHGRDGLGQLLLRLQLPCCGLRGGQVAEPAQPLLRTESRVRWAQPHKKSCLLFG